MLLALIVKHTLPILLLVILVAWTTSAMIRIELLNAQADYYLPRTDGGADGKWRTSLHRQPRDQLRGLIITTIGLPQYPLTLVALAASLVLSVKPRATRSTRLIAGICTIVATICLTMAIYRGYYSSLGW